MNYKGIIIPGLTMEKHEFPDTNGFLRLQNPEIADGLIFPGSYSIEDIAKTHVSTISYLDLHEPFHIIGMSMGGMVAAVMASKFRSNLPHECVFHFMVTPLNSKENPAIPDKTLTEWNSVELGDEAGMKKILLPFFSKDFLKKNYAKFKDYANYRTQGGNRQTPEAFMKQVNAARQFDGIKYYSQVNQQECHFLYGAKDRVITKAYHEELKKICPNATHQTEDVGHMVNIEKPELFNVA